VRESEWTRTFDVQVVVVKCGVSTVVGRERQSIRLCVWKRGNR
jgi:hypothetical protein